MVKDRVLAAARMEIQKKGFRFTMNDLAKRLGMSTKTIYELYPSKDELLHELLQNSIDELKEKELEILSDRSLDTIEKLKKALVLLPRDFQFFDLQRLDELQKYYPELWIIIDQFITKQWDGILELINEGVSSGKLRSFNTDLFIEVYIGGLYRLLEQSSKKESKMKLIDALEEMTDILLKGIVV